MTAHGVARRMVERHGAAKAKALVFNRLAHWELSVNRTTAPVRFIRRDFWRRTAQALPRWAR